MNYLLLLLLIAFSTTKIRAEYALITKVEKNGLEISAYAARFMGDDLETEIDIRIYLSNKSDKKFSVITRFDKCSPPLRNDKEISLFLLFSLEKGINGLPNKRSLEGCGVVFLNPGEATETKRYKLKLVGTETYEQVIKKINVIYAVNPDNVVKYNNLWQGEIETNNKSK